MSEPDNGRTHEPNLREITAEIDGLRELINEKLASLGLKEQLASLRDITNERDRLYKERDDSRRVAVDAALAAAKEQTKASFDASEKAIVKAEEAQKAYNQSHNDLARKMDEQSKATMPRTETEARFRNVEEKLNEVKSSQVMYTGVEHGSKVLKDDTRSNIAIIVSVLGLLAMLMMKLLAK